VSLRAYPIGPRVTPGIPYRAPCHSGQTIKAPCHSGQTIKAPCHSGHTLSGPVSSLPHSKLHFMLIRIDMVSICLIVLVNRYVNSHRCHRITHARYSLSNDFHVLVRIPQVISADTPNSNQRLLFPIRNQDRNLTYFRRNTNLVSESKSGLRFQAS
jgi:hypothetical protein